MWQVNFFFSTLVHHRHKHLPLKLRKRSKCLRTLFYRLKGNVHVVLYLYPMGGSGRGPVVAWRSYWFHLPLVLSSENMRIPYWGVTVSHAQGSEQHWTSRGSQLSFGLNSRWTQHRHGLTGQCLYSGWNSLPTVHDCKGQGKLSNFTQNLSDRSQSFRNLM